MDGAIEELFEMMFRIDDICGGTGNREAIGKSFETRDREWGLNNVGRNFLIRVATRTQ